MPLASIEGWKRPRLETLGRAPKSLLGRGELWGMRLDSASILQLGRIDAMAPRAC
jgi:hypothetical protein